MKFHKGIHFPFLSNSLRCFSGQNVLHNTNSDDTTALPLGLSTCSFRQGCGTVTYHASYYDRTLRQRFSAIQGLCVKRDVCTDTSTYCQTFKTLVARRGITLTIVKYVWSYVKNPIQKTSLLTKAIVGIVFHFCQGFLFLLFFSFCWKYGQGKCLEDSIRSSFLREFLVQNLSAMLVKALIDCYIRKNWCLR